MTRIDELLEVALRDEPDASIDPSGIPATARRRSQRRRTGTAIGVTAAAVLGVAVTASVIARDHGTGPGQDAAASVASSPSHQVVHHSPTSSAPRLPAKITPASLADFVERYGDISLSHVSSKALTPVKDIDLGAAITRVGKTDAADQYLNVQVSPDPGTSNGRPNCAKLSELSLGGDGYSGPCSIRHLSDGGYLVQRSGRTADGKYAITQAELTNNDGSGVLAEATNQSGKDLDSTSHHRVEPVVSADPPMSSTQLADLVTQLDKSV